MSAIALASASESLGFATVFGQGRRSARPRQLHHEVLKDGIERWRLYPGGPLHREDGPAEIRPGATEYQESWYRYGQWHRQDAPAILRLDQENNVRIEDWFWDGKEHRDGSLPSHQVWTAGLLTSFAYRTHGVSHRDDGPAVLVTKDNGQYRMESWWQHGKSHREDGPAVTMRRHSGVITYEWRIDGQAHREDGPAVIAVSPDGSIEETWFHRGEQISPVASLL